MFLFRGASSGQDAAAAGGSQREFFAIRAARALGGAAQKVGSSIKRAAAGQSAEALRVDVEARAANSADIEAAMVQWAPLLAVADDALRYEMPEGAGQPLTYRAAFLRTRAFELALGAAAEVDTVWNGPALRPFLRNTTLTGGELPASRLPELLARARGFPACQAQADVLVSVVKADSHLEQLRGERACAGARAEELRAAVRSARRADGTKGELSEACTTSLEALSLYASFRSGQQETLAHLYDLLQNRRTQLTASRAALSDLAAEAAARKDAAEARLAAAQKQREIAVAAPRQAVERLEQDSGRKAADAQMGELEAEKRRLQIELEEVSQALAVRRDERMAVLRSREQGAAEHRQHAEGLERQLQTLRPSVFHKVVNSRANVMTEGEITQGLARTAASARGLCDSALASADSASARRSTELESQHDVVLQQMRSTLLEHAQIERARLESAVSSAIDGINRLVDDARTKRSRAAMGLMHEEDALPSRRDVRRLRKAMASVESAWSEVISVWGNLGDSGSAPSAGEDDAPAVLATLHDTRDRIVPSLALLQQADPIAYELCLSSGDVDDIDGADDAEVGSPDMNRHRQQFVYPQAQAPEPQLPHGWTSHTSPEGHVYFYNSVSQLTQWDEPTEDAAVSAGWRLFQSEQHDGAWFYHDPYSGVGVWWPELPKRPAAPTGLDALDADARIG